MTRNIVKNGIAEPEIKYIKNNSRGYQFQYNAIAQLESKTKCKTARCGFSYFVDGMRYGLIPDGI